MGEKFRKVCVLAGMHIIALLSIGCALPCFSFFLIQFKEQFQVGSGLIGTANSLCIGFTNIIAPVATIMNRRYGYRLTILAGATSCSVGLILSSYVTEVWQIFFTHSLLTGGGVCITFQTMVFFVGMNLKKSNNIGNGVLFSALGLGMLVIPLLCSLFDYWFGWKAAIRIIGAISLHSVVISVLIFRRSFNPYMEQFDALPQKDDDEDKEKYDDEENDDARTPMSIATVADDDTNGEASPCDENGKPENNDDKKEKEVAKQPSKKFRCLLPMFRSSLLVFKDYPNLLVLSVSLCFICVGSSGFIVHMIASVKYRGVTDFESAVIFGVFGVGNLLGRLTNAIPLYFKLISETNLFILSLFVVSICMSLFGLCQTFPAMLFVASMTGLFCGMYVPQIPSIARLIVPKEKFDHAYGICIVPSGVTAIFGGYIAGAIYDSSGTYTLSFFFAAGNYIIVVAMLIVSKLVTRWKSKSTGSRRLRVPTNDEEDAPVTAV
ncbi:monocarboxylate transporter 12-like [Antedon mediterranea]|uniref:monocarboxylate transporter 12-like n=1 Tax=Antedon mediterranea TaxID=105859 RepID=UPI003AF9D2AF